MTSSDGHASSAGLETCLRCKKAVKGTEAGLECDLCHYWFHTKCEGVAAEVYKALQKFEEAVKAGKTHSAIKWYCDSCSRTVEGVNRRLEELERGQAKLMEELEKLRGKQAEMEGKWTGPRDDESVVVVERNNKLLSLPVRQEINEALDVEKRKDMIVVQGIKEDEDVEEKVGMIMEELGLKKGYTVVGRIGGMRKRGVEELATESDKSRLISVKMESVADKWRVIADSRKLSSSTSLKDIFISPDLTRKQAKEDRKLRLKLKEIRAKGDFPDGVKISRGRIVGRVDGHTIYDPTV